MTASWIVSGILLVYVVLMYVFYLRRLNKKEGVLEEAERLSSARLYKADNYHKQLQGPLQSCDVCRRRCDPKKDYCHGCGFHVCVECQAKLNTVGDHDFDLHLCAQPILAVTTTSSGPANVHRVWVDGKPFKRGDSA